MNSKNPQDFTTDTKTALLDAAERLFANEGIAESSVRAITAQAGTNLASVNYHFGSKEGLVRAVFARRIGPLNRQRLDSLESCFSDSDGAIDLRCLLLAFVEPAVTMMMSQDAGVREFVKLLGRVLSEPSGELRSTVFEEFREVGERFTREIARLLPGTPQEEIVWRFHFMIGSMAHTVAAQQSLSHQLECLHLQDEADARTITDRLVSFFLSGWDGVRTMAKEREDAAR